jgi:hypothetical protein
MRCGKRVSCDCKGKNDLVCARRGVSGATRIIARRERYRWRPFTVVRGYFFFARSATTEWTEIRDGFPGGESHA